jgi:Uma2 family endonuclease
MWSTRSVHGRRTGAVGRGYGTRAGAIGPERRLLGMSALVRPSEIHRVSIEEYHRMIESGGLSEDTHVELIDGWVVDKSPRSPEHENAIRWLIRWLRRNLADEFDFLVTGSLTLGNSEPEPDIAIIESAPTTLEHPSRALLVIEVALTSRDRDLRTKPTIYAPAVDEYWVVDLERSCIVVHRDPENGAYAGVTTHERGAELSPRAVKLAPLDTDALFATAFAERHS